MGIGSKKALMVIISFIWALVVTISSYRALVVTVLKWYWGDH
jgi:hypothetical protein